MVAQVAPLNLDPPVIISAPSGLSKTWAAKSNTANRTRRVSIELDPENGSLLKREDFKDKHWIDRAVGFGIAAHEGALFGWPNLVLGVLTTLGLVLLSVSGIILWWKRRDQGVLGVEAWAQSSHVVGTSLRDPDDRSLPSAFCSLLSHCTAQRMAGSPSHSDCSQLARPKLSRTVR